MISNIKDVTIEELESILEMSGMSKYALARVIAKKTGEKNHSWECRLSRIFKNKDASDKEKRLIYTSIKEYTERPSKYRFNLGQFVLVDKENGEKPYIGVCNGPFAGSSDATGLIYTVYDSRGYQDVVNGRYLEPARGIPFETEYELCRKAVEMERVRISQWLRCDYEKLRGAK